MSDTQEPNTQYDNDPDATIDEDVVYDDTESVQDTVKRLKEKLSTCQAERQEYLDGWQRAQADIINIKKRSQGEQDASRERITINILEEILPVFDSFDMAFKDKSAWETAPPQWRKGVEYIHTQLLSFLQSNNVSIIEPIGQMFNHTEHHSVAMVECEEVDDGKVLEVIRKGYKFGETIIRPADVRVGSRKE